jgi:hypothetical protein
VRVRTYPQRASGLTRPVARVKFANAKRRVVAPDLPEAVKSNDPGHYVETGACPHTGARDDVSQNLVTLRGSWKREAGSGKREAGS